MKNQQKISKEVVLQRMQALCARSEKCTGDIKVKLVKLGLNETEIQFVVQKLVNDGFVDNFRYARFFVRDKSRLNKWGRVKIVSVLKSKGVSEGIINKALLEISPETNKKTLTDLVARKAKQIKAKSTYELKSKLIRFGMSRGFEMDLVINVVNEVITE
ncbi:MAG: RecX family transcriptional regulator [Bacteroidales bacterium]|nr:RecX family transcriptional regulator [Bacteroidales bacterium]